MQPAYAEGSCPRMVYWISASGTILRVESENADLVRKEGGIFLQPFTADHIIGRNLFEFIKGIEIHHLYQALMNKVLRTGVSITFPYRCDGPHVRREMIMSLSLENETVRYESILLRETPRERQIPAGTNSATTLVAICSFCQRYRFPLTSTIWKDLDYLLLEAELPDKFDFSHGLCRACYQRFADDLK